MKKITLTILFIVAVVAAWAQKPDKKNREIGAAERSLPDDRLPGDCGKEEEIFL